MSEPRPKSKVSREQLEQAATMRANGATWNAIRETTGAKLGSSGWFRAWEREGIEHRPAGAPKPKFEPAQPEPTRPRSRPSAKQDPTGSW